MIERRRRPVYEPQAIAAAAPAFLVLEVADDPRDSIPPYSERPEEIRVRFASRLAAGGA